MRALEMEMKAATKALLAYIKRVEDGSVKDSALRHAMKKGMSPDEVAETVRRVRLSKASLELQSAPLKYQQRASKPVTLPTINCPTPEWMHRNNGQIETRSAGSDIRVKGYRIKHVIESQAEKFSMDARSATERYMEDSQWHERIKVADWNGSGGGSSVSRLGGLGQVPQMVREGHARYDWVQSRLDPAMKAISDYLILRVLNNPNQSPFSLEDFGRYMFPGVKDKRSLTCYATGAVWVFGNHLAWLYKQPGCPKVVRISDEERELAHEMRRLEGVR